jgi:hypothetical protein
MDRTGSPSSRKRSRQQGGQTGGDDASDGVPAILVMIDPPKARAGQDAREHPGRRAWPEAWRRGFVWGLIAR